MVVLIDQYHEKISIFLLNVGKKSWKYVSERHSTRNCTNSTELQWCHQNWSLV